MHGKVLATSEPGALEDHAQRAREHELELARDNGEQGPDHEHYDEREHARKQEFEVQLNLEQIETETNIRRWSVGIRMIMRWSFILALSLQLRKRSKSKGPRVILIMGIRLTFSLPLRSCVVLRSA